MADEGVFQVGFGILVSEVEEFEDKGMFDGSSGVSCRPARNACLFQHRGFVARQRRAFVELAIDLALKLAHRPAAAQGFGLIKGSMAARSPDHKTNT